MILSSLGRYREFGLLILRVGLGAMFVWHGAPKLLGGPEQWKGLGAAMGNLGLTAVPVFWGFMAAVAEGVGGACLVLGLAFRPACILLAFTMGVAATFHLNRGDGLQGAAHAIEVGVVFLSLIFLGPGKYSIDGK
ncbi:MAG TPA: DoxX family protein [Candidatus Polarisedimenticolia bacterium]|nr:DoxX family protein [Candidatus Polarisedimenticolia bacterium]